jgi:hypothetical protein
MPARASEPEPVAFAAVLRVKDGVNLYVAVPKRVTAHFGRRDYVPVTATLAGKAFPQTLVPAGEGRHILYVNVPMQRHAKAALGDRVTVTLAADRKPRMPAMHPALAAALKARPGAKAAFDALRPSRRKDVLRYLHNLKSEAAVERNVKRFVAGLETGALPMGM